MTIERNCESLESTGLGDSAIEAYMLKRSDLELSYDHHLQPYRAYLRGDGAKDAYWYHKAQYVHALVVCDAIRNVHQTAVILGESVQNSEVRFQLTFGVGRRTKFIWLSLRRLLSLILPQRNEPLPIDDAEEAAQALNVIYINIRGALDNLAWCLVSLGNESAQNFNPGQVNLFGREFQRVLKTSGIDALVAEFAEWNKELKERRDPAAHRIPLSVPPAFLDETTQEKYAATLSTYDEALKKAIKAAGEGVDSLDLFDDAKVHSVRLQRIGTFKPVFVHHPGEGFVSIYPVVPTDIATLARISARILQVIARQLTS